MLILSNSRRGFLDGREDDFQMPYTLNEIWNGMERMSPEWCRVQAKSIANVVQMARDRKGGVFREDFFNGDFFADDLDCDGLIAMLNEMAVKDYKTASGAAFRIMSHLLYVHTSPNNPAVKHWLEEVDNFLDLFADGVGVDKKHEFGNTNLKNELKENWSDIYDRAVKKVFKKAKDAEIFPFDTKKIPEEASWSVEDFLTKSPKELVRMLY